MLGGGHGVASYCLPEWTTLCPVYNWRGVITPGGRPVSIWPEKTSGVKLKSVEEGRGRWWVYMVPDGEKKKQFPSGVW